MGEGTRTVARCQPFCVVCAATNGTASPDDTVCEAGVTRSVHDMQTFQHAKSAVQCSHEVPQLHGRKFPEAVLDFSLRQLEKDPAGGAAALPTHEVQTAAHRSATHLGVRLHLDENLPPLVTALQLAHVLGAILSRERGAHLAVRSGCTLIEYAAETIPASLDSDLHELSCLRCGARGHGTVLSQVRRPGRPRSSSRVAGRPALGSGWGGTGGSAYRAGDPHWCLLGRRDARCGKRGGRCRIPHPASPIQ